MHHFLTFDVVFGDILVSLHPHVMSRGQVAAQVVLLDDERVDVDWHRDDRHRGMCSLGRLGVRGSVAHRGCCIAGLGAALCAGGVARGL